VDTRVTYFELTIWPHMRAAFNLARWLARDNHDAEDIVQESFVKAFKAQESVRGVDARAWLLTIVRNTAMDFLRRQKPRKTEPLGDSTHEPKDTMPDPERTLVEQARREQVRRAISNLPADFREVIVLREMEEMSYKEIAGVLDVPLGTVMSRLSRARNLLLKELGGAKEAQHELP
jgi:RNA polymerase sigma-70 factor (ECF subfamily)